MRDESLSKLGFGMLRVDVENDFHREALRDAIVAGIDLFDLGDYANDPVRFAARAKALLGLLTEYGQVPTTRLLVRGGLGSADVLATTLSPFETSPRIEWVALVADPEFTLSQLDWDHSRLFSLLAHEMDTLEALAASGNISAYGVASAGFTYSKESPDALALEPLVTGRENLDWASNSESPANSRAANRRHFQWLEFPFNLYESAAFADETQTIGTQTESLLSAAHRFGFTTVARRPFDAMTEHGLRRLIAYPDHHRLDLDEAVHRTLETALAAETEALAKPNQARVDAGTAPEALDPLWAHRLRSQLRHVTDPEQWKEILRRRIDPDLASLRARAIPNSDRYFDAMTALLLAVRLWVEKRAAERNERLRAKIVESAPSLGRRRLAEDRDLALLALRIYRSIPGLSYVLVGMRSPTYVRSITKAESRFGSDDVLPPEEIQAALIAVHAALEKDTP